MIRNTKHEADITTREMAMAGRRRFVCSPVLVTPRTSAAGVAVGDAVGVVVGSRDTPNAPLAGVAVGAVVGTAVGVGVAVAVGVAVGVGSGFFTQ